MLHPIVQDRDGQATLGSLFGEQRPIGTGEHRPPGAAAGEEYGLIPGLGTFEMDPPLVGDEALVVSNRPIASAQERRVMPARDEPARDLDDHRGLARPSDDEIADTDDGDTRARDRQQPLPIGEVPRADDRLIDPRRRTQCFEEHTLDEGGVRPVPGFRELLRQAVFRERHPKTSSQAPSRCDPASRARAASRTSSSERSSMQA